MHEFEPPLSLLAEDPIGIDDSGRIVYVKSTMQQLMKYPSQKVLMKLWRDFVPLSSEHRLAEFNAAIRSLPPFGKAPARGGDPLIAPSLADSNIRADRAPCEQRSRHAATAGLKQRLLVPRASSSRPGECDEMNALREERDRALSALYALTEAVIWVDTGNAITELNGRAEVLTGWSAEEARGRSLEALLPGVPATGDSPFHCASRAAGTRSDLTLIARSGKRTAVEVLMAPLRDATGTPRGAVLTLRGRSRRAQPAFKVPKGEADRRAAVHFQPPAVSDPLEEELREGIESQSFVLHYQPQINLNTGAIVGVEALLRWQHPTRGLLAPAAFMAIAEESGLIIPLGRLALRQACHQAQLWRAAGLAPLVMSVNVSTVELNNAGFIEGVSDALRGTGLDPKYLELEVTETFMAPNAAGVAPVLASLSNLGVKIVLDDFGTGYSSLSFLKHYPVDTLKIDRSFIQDLTSHKGSSSIVRALINLGKSLKLRVVAEAVETAEQVSWLQRHDCIEAQGYYFCAPVPAEKLAALLKNGRLCDSASDQSRKPKGYEDADAPLVELAS